jgi:FkbM family methyltransferase
MKRFLIDVTHSALGKLGYRVTQARWFEELTGRSQILGNTEFLIALLEAKHEQLITTWLGSQSQFKQDVFVQHVLSFKQNGFFVEFGATDGIELSNTHQLEKAFGWSGILAEPARGWHSSLANNRSCAIDHSCVWKVSGEQIEFTETMIGGLSTISAFSDSDALGGLRRNRQRYRVPTISLMDLLQKHNAPFDIDYLSIDTEGSELAILEAFDFNSYNISIITCEHNFRPDREKIFNLLSSKGFIRQFEEFSDVDDWYVNSKILESSNH